ncbi:MAG: UbiA family prenyltransferase [bacterium]
MFRILKVFRLGKAFSILLGVFTISLYAYGSFDVLRDSAVSLTIALGIASLFLLICAGYMMNDCCDLGYDIINNPRRVLINSAISKRGAQWMYRMLFLMGLLIAAIVNAWFFGLIMLDTLAVYFYNLYSKRLAYIKDILVSLLVVSIYPLSFALTSGGTPSPRRDSLFIFPIWLFLMVMSYELSQDILDIHGDRSGGGNTLPSLIGIIETRRLATILALVSIPIACAPFCLGMCGMVYLIGFVITLPVFVVSLFFSDRLFSHGVLFFIRAITLASLIDLMVGR